MEVLDQALAVLNQALDAQPSFPPTPNANK
jgi:hypothetical protein